MQLVAAVTALLAVVVARPAAAFEEAGLIGFTPVATCTVAEAGPPSRSTSRQDDHSSVLNADPPTPALALPRGRSGPDGRQTSKDLCAGDPNLVFLSGVVARRYEPARVARWLAGDASEPRTRLAFSTRLARGPPAGVLACGPAT